MLTIDEGKIDRTTGARIYAERVPLTHRQMLALFAVGFLFGFLLSRLA